MAAPAINYINADEFLTIGNSIKGHSRVASWARASQESSFRAKFGVSTQTCSDIWLELQLAPDASARTFNSKYFLMALRWLKKLDGLVGASRA